MDNMSSQGRFRTPPGHPGRPRARAALMRLPQRLMTRNRLIWAGVAFLIAAIIANAVMFQTAKHPQPLFERVSKPADQHVLPPVRSESLKQVMFDSKPANGPGNAARPSSPMVPPAGIPVEKARANTPLPDPAPGDRLIAEIQRELSKRGHFKGEVTGKQSPQTTQAIKEFQFAQRVAVDGKPSEVLLKDILASKSNMRDELMDIVKRAQTDEPPQRTVKDVQRALNKAGYGPLSEDGQMGPGTRTALQKFEADRRMPPRGEPKGPVLRALASASGLTIAQP